MLVGSRKIIEELSAESRAKNLGNHHSDDDQSNVDIICEHDGQGSNNDAKRLDEHGYIGCQTVLNNLSIRAELGKKLSCFGAVEVRNILFDD